MLKDAFAQTDSEYNLHDVTHAASGQISRAAILQKQIQKKKTDKAPSA